MEVDEWLFVIFKLFLAIFYFFCFLYSVDSQDLELFSMAKKLQSSKNLQTLQFLSMKTIVNNFDNLKKPLDFLGMHYYLILKFT